ncbi:L-aminopeptidase/D-esterase [Tindallia magadiensis]|uniref:L-aminopeptidase/D-esterase n=1 Tax=Tindallia magadiensis TaxID=69895 RepID=A0A1I3CCW1_9FIRM|nr:P1 family peptidase [Tindallia magadiensis]SFH72263.1 L-aminopeptidase/D-esterase [Tindallia magadiensis]
MEEKSNKIMGNFHIGHSQHWEAATGCTVVICPKGATAGVDVRGGAPGTRETDLLNPVNLVDKIHAVLLAGGSAFGLDAAGGVMRYLEEKGYGFDAKVAKIPIVCSAVLFDLPVGNAQIRPDASMGYKASLNSEKNCFQVGSIGAGTGATVGKLKGYHRAMKGGIGYGALQSGALEVSALVAVNALGDVIDSGTGEILAGLRTEDGKGFAETEKIMIGNREENKVSLNGNTTIGVVMTNGIGTKSQMTKIASMAQNGIARSIRPSHTMVDGDTIFAMSSGDIEADTSLMGVMAAIAVERAIIDGVTKAEDLAGIPCAKTFKTSLF